MKQLTDILAALRSFSWLSYGDTLRPYRDFMVLLVLSFLALIGSLAFNVWHFFDVVSREATGQDAAIGTDVLDQATLEEGRAALEARAEEEARYKGEYRFIDPAR